MAEFWLTSLCHNVGSGLMAEPMKRIFLQQLYSDSFIITDAGRAVGEGSEFAADREGEKKG
jgi:hypothetical protein